MYLDLAFEDLDARNSRTVLTQRFSCEPNFCKHMQAHLSPVQRHRKSFFSVCLGSLEVVTIMPHSIPLSRHHLQHIAHSQDCCLFWLGADYKRLAFGVRCRAEPFSEALGVSGGVPLSSPSSSRLPRERHPK